MVYFLGSGGLVRDGLYLRLFFKRTTPVIMLVAHRGGGFGQI